MAGNAFREVPLVVIVVMSVCFFTVIIILSYFVSMSHLQTERHVVKSALDVVIPFVAKFEQLLDVDVGYDGNDNILSYQLRWRLLTTINNCVRSLSPWNIASLWAMPIVYSFAVSVSVSECMWIYRTFYGDRSVSIRLWATLRIHLHCIDSERRYVY